MQPGRRGKCGLLVHGIGLCCRCAGGYGISSKYEPGSFMRWLGWVLNLWHEAWLWGLED